MLADKTAGTQTRRVKTYRKILPFFMELVVGDFIVGTYWGLLSIILGTPLYTVVGDFIVGTYWGLLSIILGTPLYTTWF